MTFLDKDMQENYNIFIKFWHTLAYFISQIIINENRFIFDTINFRFARNPLCFVR